MAITNQDTLLASFLPSIDILKVGFTAEAVGLQHSTFYNGGFPGAATAPSPGLSGASITSYPGQIPFPATVPGKDIYLARMEANQAGGCGMMTLADRIWHNSGISVTTTTAQTINSTPWPSRDRNGTTDGVGVQIGIEVSSATTNAAAVTNTVMSYTSSDGIAGRTATIASFPATAVAGTFIPFVIQAGDLGVRSIQSFNPGTSYGGGAIHIVAFNEIVGIGTPTANVGYQQDAWAIGMPKMQSGTVPFMLYLISATTVGVSNAQVIWAQG